MSESGKLGNPDESEPERARVCVAKVSYWTSTPAICAVFSMGWYDHWTVGQFKSALAYLLGRTLPVRRN